LVVRADKALRCAYLRTVAKALGNLQFLGMDDHSKLETENA